MSQMTVRAAADHLGVAYSTFKRWIRDGSVRTTVTEGGHHRVSDSEVERLLARAQPDAQRSPAHPPEEALEGLSARNRLHGFVDEVRIDGLLAQVKLRVGGQPLTAVITADAVRALRLHRGDEALAIVTSTEVMIARAAQPSRSVVALRRRSHKNRRR
jgi:molybdopterin-binding protein